MLLLGNRETTASASQQTELIEAMQAIEGHESDYTAQRLWVNPVNNNLEATIHVALERRNVARDTTDRPHARHIARFYGTYFFGSPILTAGYAPQLHASFFDRPSAPDSRPDGKALEVLHQPKKIDSEGFPHLVTLARAALNGTEDFNQEETAWFHGFVRSKLDNHDIDISRHTLTRIPDAGGKHWFTLSGAVLQRLTRLPQPELRIQRHRDVYPLDCAISSTDETMRIRLGQTGKLRIAMDGSPKRMSRHQPSEEKVEKALAYVARATAELAE